MKTMQAHCKYVKIGQEQNVHSVRYKTLSMMDTQTDNIFSVARMPSLLHVAQAYLASQIHNSCKIAPQLIAWMANDW